MAHAILSPSGASRWLACTPSARLETQFPDSAGEAAREGTLAHQLGELFIKRKLGLIHEKPYNKELAEITANPLYSPSMWDYCEDYAVFVIELYHQAQTENPNAQIFTETQVSLEPYVEEGFGTVDNRIISEPLLRVIDLKFGKGVPVSVTNNKQLMLYALGALKESDWLFNIEEIELTIYQPRIDNISTWRISVGELLAWAQEELIPRARLAFAGEGDFVAGSHCRFCRAKSSCRVYNQYVMGAVADAFEIPELLTDDEIANVLQKAADFKNYVTSVEEYALSEAVKGRKWPGFKLVEGRSNRRYESAEKVIEVLKKKGYTEEAYYKPREIKPLGELERELGKADFNRIVDPLLVKPKGSPTLVEANDKRPELNKLQSAIDAFS